MSTRRYWLRAAESESTDAEQDGEAAQDEDTGVPPLEPEEPVA